MRCGGDAFVDAGGNLVDTANVCVGGEAEAIVGRWFVARPSTVTDRVVLATKGRFSPDPDLNAVGSSRRALSRALAGSRRGTHVHRAPHDNPSHYLSMAGITSRSMSRTTRL